MNNVKLVYRVMCDYNLLHEHQIKQSGVPRLHEERIAEETSDTRRFSGGWVFLCEDGDILSVTFALYGCDREAIGRVVVSIEDIVDDSRDLMSGSVENSLIKSLQRQCSH